MDWWTKSTGAVVAALMLAAPTVAWAEWHRVTTSSEVSIYSVDPERVRTIGGRRQVWMKGDHGRNRTEKARSSMTLLSIDCSASTIKTLSDSRYDSFGKTISSRSFPDYGVGYEPITPETIAEGVAKAVCSEQGAAM
jgi:hypothetical protein